MLNLPWVLVTELVMTSFIVWIIAYMRENADSLSLRSFSVSIILLVMMGSMFDAIAYYIAMPKTFFNVVFAVNISMISMAISIVYILWTAVKSKIYSMKGGTVLAFALILGWNEVSMAILLRLIAYYFSGPSSFIGYLSYFSLSITSFLFLAPMLAEMIYFIWLRFTPGMERRVSVSLLLMQVADPAIIGKSVLVTPLLVAYSVIMILAIYYALSFVYSNRHSITEPQKRMVNWFIFIVVLSTAGIIEPIFIHNPFGLSWLLFAVSMMSSMVLYFEIVLGFFTPVSDRRAKRVAKPAAS